MDGDEFYEEFKAVLTYLGLSWGEKHQLKVTIENDQICFEVKGRKVLIDVNKMDS